MDIAVPGDDNRTSATNGHGLAEPPAPVPPGARSERTWDHVVTAVVRLTIVVAAMVAIWSGLRSVWAMVTALGQNALRVDLGLLGLVVGPALLARRPWARTLTQAACWLLMIGLAVMAVLALSGGVPVRYDLPESLASLAGPPAVLLTVGGSLLTVLWLYGALTSRAGRAWFGLDMAGPARTHVSALAVACAVIAAGMVLGLILALGGRTLETVARRGGVLANVTVGDRHAYVLLGNEVGVLDLTDPDRPRLLGQTVAALQPQGPFAQGLSLAAQGHQVFVINPEHPALQMIDAADPARPRRVGETPLGFEPRDLAVSDDTIAVVGERAEGGGAGHLVTLAGTTTITPTVTGGFLFDETPVDVEVAGDRAVVLARPPCWPCQDDAAARAALLTFDLVLGDVPMLASSTELPLDSAALAVVGRHAYVVTAAGQLVTVDLGDTSQPAQGETVWLGRATAPGEECFSALVASGDYLYALDTCAGQVVAVSLADPDRPRRAAAIGAVDARRIAAGQGRLFTVGPASGFNRYDSTRLGVIDVRSPDQPRLSGAWESFTAGRVVPLGSRAYVVSLDGRLVVLDISLPAQPAELAANPAADIADAGSTGKVLYVVTGKGAFGRLSESGELVGAVRLPPLADNDSWYILAIADGIAYLRGNRTTVHLVDIADPDQPVIRGTIQPGGQVLGLDATGGYAYAAVDRGGLGSYSSSNGATVAQVVAVDVTDPDAPRVAGAARSWRPLSGAAGILAHGRNLYLTESDGLRQLKLADPGQPTWDGTWSSHSGWSLAWGEDGLFCGSNELRLFHPGLVRTGHQMAELTGFLGRAIAVQDHYVYIADDTRGLAVVAVRRLADQLMRR
jgi:hypothetical protein